MALGDENVNGYGASAHFRRPISHVEISSEKDGRPNGQSSRADLNTQTNAMNPQVIEYLMKKGYVRTEQVLRQESAQVDKEGRPVFGREEYGNEKYIKGFELLSSWVDSNLDIYKVSKGRLQSITKC